ncbi:hypothetical protein FQR65_LT00238 [Abscondita terminalis]|nr:hypothetical protein FQR65_LT00238 [Abscondita terminalis]
MVRPKDKKAEKSKVKLKTTLKTKTKFLPKGANVTNTNYKIKPIIIPEQLKAKDPSESLTSRKLTFDELMKRLNHVNGKVRLDGCNGIIELLNISSQINIELQLHNLLLNSAKLFIDVDVKVRRQSIEILTKLLTKVSNNKVSPFFDILISYTACAMTHLDVNIQEDSLLIIDAYLNHIPLIISKSHLRLFPNFLMLISKLRHESTTSRTLATDLRLSTTTLRWRMNVLHRLHRILKSIVKDDVEKKDSAPKILIKDVEGYSIPLYKGVRTISSDFLRGVRERIHQADDLIEHVDSLLPLLYETWVEAVQTTQAYETEHTLIEYDVAVILSCSLGVFDLLWLYVAKIDKPQTQRFLTKTNQRYFNRVLKLFPYQMKATTGPLVRIDVNIEPKLINENLLVCSTFIRLLKYLEKNENFQEKIITVIDYIKSCLVNRNYIKGADVPLLLSSLRSIFFEHYAVWNRYQLDFEDLVYDVIHFYRHNTLSGDVDVQLFKLLTDMMDVPKLRCVIPYKNWLRGLPKMLCKPQISLEVLKCISWLSRQDDAGLKESIRENMRNILDNLNKIHVIGVDVYPYSLIIAHIINVVETYTKEDIEYLNAFAEFCDDEYLNVCITQIIKDKPVVNNCL